MKDYPGYRDYLVRRAHSAWDDPCSYGKKVTTDLVADCLDDIVKAGGTDGVKFSSHIRLHPDGIYTDYVLLASRYGGKDDISVVLVSMPDMSCAAMAKAYAKSAGKDLSDFLVLGGGSVRLSVFDTSKDAYPCVSLTDTSGIKRPRSRAVVKACLDSYIAGHSPVPLDKVTYMWPDVYYS